MSAEEVVLTSRRALLRAEGGGWTPGRLRVSDRVIRFTASDASVVEVAMTDIGAMRLQGRPRRTLVLDTPQGRLRLRCYALPAIAALLTLHR